MKSLSAVAVSALLLASGNLATLSAQHDHGGMPGMQASVPKILKAGKKGEVTFDAPTKVGESTLKPGTYTVQHRVEGEQHFVRFEPLGSSANNGSGEVQCKVEPQAERVPQTAVYTTSTDGGSRVTKVVIEGERVAHVF